MRKPSKLIALKPFPFHGVTVEANEELQPDTKEQADLLVYIGFAVPKNRGYLNRSIKPAHTAVMTTAVEG